MWLIKGVRQIRFPDGPDCGLIYYLPPSRPCFGGSVYRAKSHEGDELIDRNGYPKLGGAEKLPTLTLITVWYISLNRGSTPAARIKP